MFEGLLTRKNDWVTLAPGMAESYTISKDQKIYTFKVRKGLKWSDGSPLNAKDFEYSWLRAIDPKTNATYAYWLTDNVVGAAEYNKTPTAEVAKKVGIKATDDYTFVVTLKQPVTYFLSLTAESLLYPVKKETVEKFKDQWTRPENIVSNGAYKMTYWKVQDRIVMEKNPNYYAADTVQIKKVVALPIEDRQTGVNLFQQGKLDWSGQNGAPNSLVPSLKKDPNFRLFPGTITYYYWFNTTKKPLNDIRVRQALTLAIDRKSIVEKVTRGGEMAADHLVSQNMGDYKSPKGVTSGDYAADVKKAKDLLAQAGFANGKGFPELNLLYNSDENHKKLAQAISQMWKKELGIEVKPFNQEWKVYLATQRDMAFDISRAGWAADYADPNTFLELLLSTSENNHSGWKNAKYDELLKTANSMPAGAKRNELLSQAESMILNEVPMAPIFTYTNFGFMRPEIAGYTGNLIDRPYIKYMSKK